MKIFFIINAGLIFINIILSDLESPASAKRISEWSPEKAARYSRAILCFLMALYTLIALLVCFEFPSEKGSIVFSIYLALDSGHTLYSMKKRKKNDQ